MLVSDRADSRLREQVQLGRRPRPEYLCLEERHGVRLLDWSQLDNHTQGRSVRVSLAHAAAAFRLLDRYDAILSDGEHVGVPLALAMQVTGRSRPHVVICHHLTSGRKPTLFRRVRPHRRMTRLLVHSRRQEAAGKALGIPLSRIEFQPYGVDHLFWSPKLGREEALVVSAGREHRDYATLARAAESLRVPFFLAAGSIHSPSAHHTESPTWPANVRTGLADHPTLRDWYARSAVVVVPLIPNDFQAGVTTLMEAMSMAKAVVVTATEGQRDIVEHGVNAITVPPGDAAVLRDAVAMLLANPRERARLGANARAAVESRFSVDAYAANLARHLGEAAHFQKEGLADGTCPAPPFPDG